MEAKKPSRKQCSKCPWKVTTDPYDIPNGYSSKLHRGLKKTIAKPEARGMYGGLEIMACHETNKGEELPCVGWLVHQMGPGNNIGLRFAVIQKRIDGNVETVGPQHQRFEDTLPKKKRRR